MERDKIVFLWAEITGYMYSTFLKIVQKFDYEIIAIHWGSTTINSTQYNIEDHKYIKIIQKKNANKYDILKILNINKPKIIVISAWMDKDYISACKEYKKKNKVFIVSGLDSQWLGTFKQYIGSFYFRLFLKKIFDFIWISGKPQFAYAIHLGYNIKNILIDLYSADTNLFNIKSSFKKRFIFVGRFVEIKFLDGLITAYKNLPLNIQQEWPLFLVGDGDQRFYIENNINHNITIVNYLQPKELHLFLNDGGIALLTSHKDQWGVVVHEYALLGMPLILSSGCGAASEFLIPNYNGFVFQKGNIKDLESVLLKIANLSDSDLETFRNNSIKLANRISSETSAYSLMSCLYR